MSRALVWALVVALVGCSNLQAPAREVLADDEAYASATPSSISGFDAPLVRKAEAESPFEAPAPEEAPERQVIYSAALRMVVAAVAHAARTVQTLAEQAGGHLQESDARSITVRVPAARFDEVLVKIATLGEVVERSIKASDVTEQVQELDLRLDNARKTRERLVEHLSKSAEMKDTLEIEKELARVTAEIEVLEGKLRFLKSQIAMSTIRVELNSPTPQRPAQQLGLPFEWVERLGDGLVAGTVESLPRKPGFLSRGPTFDPPPEFIRYYSSDRLVEAMDADGVRLKVQKHANYDKGVLAFWTKLARKALVESRALAVGEERDLGDDRALLAGTREVAGKTYGYLLVLARTRDFVYTFEAWGPEAEFGRRKEALVRSALSLRK